ncbi:hypothetical protein HRbin30_01097 [bacterium HR30]|nr:hypothetical protein HRbin30_01097 [bacterium HR30]
MKRTISAKSERILRDLGVLPRLTAGERLVTAGTVYALDEEARVLASLVFVLEGDVLCVGYAVNRGTGWQIVEQEPYSLRSLGYWQRWLKRHGVPVFSPP